MTAAAQERWTILAGIPDVVTDEEADRSTDVSVDFKEPPSASVLTVPFRVSSPSNPYFYPYIAAADRSGLLLLCARHNISHFQSRVSYHLCDAYTGEVISLCSNLPLKVAGGSNVGLILRGQRCMVAELQPKGDGSGCATLRCYTVGEFRWVEMELAYSPPLNGRRWFGEGVVSHGGMLWWVDLSYGILACDPFADEPELLHVPLPGTLAELPEVAQNNRSAYRCLKVSGGRLRFVQIHGSAYAPVVSMWALADPAGEWNPEHSLCLADLWADKSYLNTMLPPSIPALALLHPEDSNKVYFFLGSHIFAVDLKRRMVVDFSEFRMPAPPRHIMTSSHFVHTWQYDSSSSRPADFVPTCLMKEKEYTAMSSLFASMFPKIKIARKRSRNSVTREQMIDEMMMMPNHVLKRKGVPEKDLNRLAFLTMNEGGKVA